MKLKQTIRRFVLGIIVAAGVLLPVLSFNAPPASAACGSVQTSIINCNETGGTNQGKCPDGKIVDVSATCADGSKPSVVANTGLWYILLLAINIMTAGVGILAIAGIVYGSILYTSAGGNQEQLKKAYGMFTNVAIGVIAYALMYAGLNFLIPGGLFN